jgi:small subunit ribosomal protein S6
MLLLDTAAADEERAKVLADVERIIGNGGTITSSHQWGARAMAYEIAHKKDAEYHLLQFQGPREVLETLNRTLHIADGVVRFRIIKLRPGTPAPPEVRAGADEPRAEEQPAVEPAGEPAPAA